MLIFIIDFLIEHKKVLILILLNYIICSVFIVNRLKIILKENLAQNDNIVIKTIYTFI